MRLQNSDRAESASSRSKDAETTGFGKRVRGRLEALKNHHQPHSVVVLVDRSLVLVLEFPAPGKQVKRMPVAYDFGGQVAIVTGGAQGIGRSIAEKLRDSNAIVHVWDLAKPSFAGVEHASVDVADPTTIEKALSQTTAQHRRVDVLVNNAGYVGSNAAVLDFDPVEWRRSIEVNLVGVFEVCRLVVPLMLQSGYGRVVNMASLAGKEGTPFTSAYSAAKAGVIAFTKSFGKELAGTNVRVNAIAPAAIDTDLLKQLSPELVKAMIDKSPMKRLGTVSEVSELVLWLCSEACSFNTGAIFDLSGGRAVY
jgi:3-oxoacyl-[acyl-carrier protein] reductase